MQDVASSMQHGGCHLRRTAPPLLTESGTNGFEFPKAERGAAFWFNIEAESPSHGNMLKFLC
jgi:hypothetical protein